jgi:putative sigma-54 modulation protein
MNVKTHSIKFDADVKLIDFIQTKMDKLEKFFDRIVDGEVFLRLNNEGIENKTVEVKLNLPGEQFFAESSATSFEKAMDDCFNILKRKLKKHKEKIIAH